MQRGPSPIASDQPYLKLINRREQLGFKVEETYNLRDKNIIGRSPKNEIVLKDPFISSEHGRIWQSGGIYYLEDLGSKNGSLLNGQPVSGPSILKNGDKISFGQLEFLFVTEQK
ncbi:FHA domain-containing protein [Dehalobacterium formicoaceticum]|uniref:FHA domain-containing protein n=1 Tax=Dehalobacterium formicoaceticum TaxID=51515 RepID=A0ABT1Y6E3_9FIRM|nr:FHA domain-containing protein [Dehalobacterium formicoaceticum]MCR6545484.1 FHA domain-containing protein [Dehalobacterium formicoaceticum]